VCRFLGVPGDMIDAGAGRRAITYANITQRNLQLLIMNLGPGGHRREKALRSCCRQPRYVKLNTDALLRMDLKSRYDGYKVAIDRSGSSTPSEARELEDRAPFTPEQIDEFKTLFPQGDSAPATNPDGSAAA
jgi:hypothetical protein